MSFRFLLLLISLGLLFPLAGQSDYAKKRVKAAPTKLEQAESLSKTDPAAAIRLLNETLKSKVGTAELTRTFLLLGDIYADIGQDELALGRYGQALEVIRPEAGEQRADVLARRGKLQLRQGDFTAARATFNDCLRLAAAGGAAHYLLKPVDIDDLVEAVARVRGRAGLKERGEVTQALLDNLRAGREQAVLDRLALPLIDGLEIIRPDEINYLEAADNFTTFHLLDGRKLLICRKLKFYDALLGPAGFYRIHRSTVVNIDRVRRYHKGKGGAITLADGTELLVAATRKNGLLERLG